MSYMRPNSPLTYVDGESGGDYVYGSGDGKIEDYGSISTETIIDILLNQSHPIEQDIFEHLMKRLIENLGIKMRLKPLTGFEEWLNEYCKIRGRVGKEIKKMREELKDEKNE